MGYLTREDILGRTEDCFKMETVDVPEWGGQVIVRELTAYEVEKLGEQGKGGNVGIAGLRAQVVAWAALGEDGKRLFNWNNKEVQQLGQLSNAAINRVALAVLRISGLEEQPDGTVGPSEQSGDDGSKN